MREALKIAQRQKELQRQNKVKAAKIRELTKNRKVACRSGLARPLSQFPITEIATLAPAIYI